MNEYSNNPMDNFQPNNDVKRPVFLTVLCILSFISVSYGILTSLINLGFSGPNRISADNTKAKIYFEASKLEDHNMQGMANEFRKLGNMVELQLTEKFHTYFFIELMICIAGVLAVYLMFKGKRNGYYFYIVYCLFAAFSASLACGFNNVPAFLPIAYLIGSGIWILLYGLNLKWIKN
jgi:hypothetical protein